ncbi:MAG: hypothetical protein M1829_000591 [Trizodia sp. TS-e1964]|nr:MAG: hypothetical protein M1829_000591 [Trizodia sp. TS-e1964]
MVPQNINAGPVLGKEKGEECVEVPEVERCEEAGVADEAVLVFNPDITLCKGELVRVIESTGTGDNSAGDEERGEKSDAEEDNNEESEEEGKVDGISEFGNAIC